MLLLYLLHLPQAFALLSWLDFYKQQPLQLDHDYNPFATKDFDAFINATLTEFLTPGLAIAVVYGNNTFAKGYGYADIHSKDPVTPYTLFCTASTTKSFTAALTSKLVDSNDTAYANISWTTKLVDLIREDFVLSDEYATSHTTLVDAMAHRTGMPRHDLSAWNSDPSLRETVRRLRYLPLHNEIRTKWEYCNIMYHALALAIEAVTGGAMGDLLHEWLLEPLGMHETFYSIPFALAFAAKSDGEVTVARGYMYDNATSTHVQVPWSDIPPSSGASGIISNVMDYTHWIRMFLHSSNPSNAITPSAVKTMTAAHMPMDSDWRPCTGSAFYGLGVNGGVYRGYENYGHNGAINGYMTAMLWMPELDWGVTIMQNSYSLVPEIVLWRLVDDFLRTPEAERFDMTDIAKKGQAVLLKRLENAKERLYPEAEGAVAVSPALPLEAYEGVYHHPAYQNLELSVLSEPRERGMPGAPLPLYATPTAKSYLNMSFIIHHVSGEHWWAQLVVGPGSFLVDEAMKAKFEVGVDGKVRGLGLQAEPSIDELAWFEKIE